MTPTAVVQLDPGEVRLFEAEAPRPILPAEAPAMPGRDAAPEAGVLTAAASPRIGIEAAIRQGWDLFLRPDDGFVGMTGFGASAPAPALYRHFGITPEATADLARKLIKGEDEWR